VSGAQTADAEIIERLRKLEAALAEQERVLAEQARISAEQRAQLRRLEAMTARGGRAAAPASPVADGDGRVFGVPPRLSVPATNGSVNVPGSRERDPVRSAQAQTPTDSPTAPARQPPPEEQAEQVADIVSVADVGGVLTPEGYVSVEPSFQFSRSTVNRVEVAGFTVFPAINIGRFDISESDRNTFVGTLTARYGITNRLEAEVRVPWNYRSDNVTTRAIGVGADEDVTTSTSTGDLGDIEVAARYQINRGPEGWPFFIANLRFKTRTGLDPFEVDRDPVSGVEQELPTGTGFRSVQPGLTTLVRSDPAVFFATVNYTYNFERDVGNGFGTLDQGDSIDITFGMGVSLNETSSFTLGFDYGVFFPTEQDGEDIEDSDTLQIGTLLIGYTYRVSDSMSLNFTVQPSITEEAPDVQFVFRVPISWQLFD